MTEANLSVHIVDGVRYLTFDHPGKLNVLSRATLRAIVAQMHEAAATDVAVVFSGAGDRSFSAGMHLDSFANLDVISAGELIADVGDMLTAVRRCAVPTIAAINGYCLGAAFELALVCDVRVAASDASIGLPEVKVGIPSVLDASLLIQYVGLGLAKEVMLTGDHYPVQALAGSALFNKIVPREQLAAAVDGYLDRFRPLSRRALASQKALFENWINVSHLVGLDLSRREFAGTFAHADTAERLERARASLGGGR
jgi:enoyl-CoA hydratase